MKRLGLLGTFSEAASGSYLSTINAEIQKEYGGGTEASVNIQTLELPVVESLLATEAWNPLLQLMLKASRAFVCNPVKGIVVCGSRLQPLAPEIRQALNIPVLDMGYSLASRLDGFSVKCVAVLGAYTTREETMWVTALAPRRVILPCPADSHRLREMLAHAFQRGQPVPQDFRFEAMRIIGALRKENIQAILLAAPQLSAVIRPDDFNVEIFDAAEIHASVAGMWAAHREMGITPPCCIGAN